MTDLHDQGVVALASSLLMRQALSGVGPEGSCPVLPWHVAGYAAGVRNVDPDRVADALRRDVNLYRFYRAVLQARSFGTSPRQAAAQGLAWMERRQGEGFVLEFRASRAQPDQVYVTLSIDPLRDVPLESVLHLHVLAQGDLLRLEFPPLSGRSSQRLFLADSPELRLMRRNDSELVLVMP